MNIKKFLPPKADIFLLFFIFLSISLCGEGKYCPLFRPFFGWVVDTVVSISPNLTARRYSILYTAVTRTRRNSGRTTTRTWTSTVYQSIIKMKASV